MKYPEYPSPCLKCERAEVCQANGYHKNCQVWHMWWLWWWKYLQQNLGKEEPKSKERNKFRYEHPDIIRKELAKNPCDSCFRKEFCAKPCYKYLAWYDAWVEIARRRLGM